MGLTEPTEQSDSKEVNDNEDVKVSAVRGRKIIITIVSVIPAARKLSTTSTKETLLEGRQDVKVKKIWIETIS